MLGERQFAVLAAELLTNNAAHVMVDLSDDARGHIRFGTLVGAATRSTHLRILNLRKNRLGVLTHPSCSPIQPILTSLLRHPHLTRLDLSENYLGDENLFAISEGLKTNTALVSLELASNGLEKEGAVSLARALVPNQHLQELNIGANAIENEGFAAILLALTMHPAIKELRVPFCHLTSDCMPALLNFLRDNTTLEVLDLSYNKLTGFDVARIVEVIRHRQLFPKRLVFSGCHIGNAGAVALLSLLNEANSLISVEVSECKINDLELVERIESLSRHGDYSLMHHNERARRLCYEVERSAVALQQPKGVLMVDTQGNQRFVSKRVREICQAIRPAMATQDWCFALSQMLNVARGYFKQNAVLRFFEGVDKKEQQFYQSILDNAGQLMKPANPGPSA